MWIETLFKHRLSDSNLWLGEIQISLLVINLKLEMRFWLSYDIHMGYGGCVPHKNSYTLQTMYPLHIERMGVNARKAWLVYNEAYIIIKRWSEDEYLVVIM